MVGRFGAIGRTRVLGATAWNGSTFERLGTPALSSFQSVIHWNGALLASRGSSSTTAHDELFQWNGSEWDPIATANGAVVAMCLHQGGIVAIGSFTVIGGVAANHVARFDGSAWYAMGAGIPVSFSAGTNVPLVSVGSDVYTLSNTAIYRYDGSVWTTSTGSALNGQINALATDGVNLYAGGFFTKAGADSCPGVARWDGSAWHRVGVGTTSVTTLTWWNGQLVANLTDGTSRISAFDGTHWYGLGDESESVVSRLRTCGTRLVALFSYRPASGDMADVRTFDGTSWVNVRESWGPDMTGATRYTNSARVVNGLLYTCGGSVHMVNPTGAIRTNNIAAWDGSAWSAVGTGVSAQPMHVGVWGSALVVSGSLSLSGVGGSKIARWDGGNWANLGDVSSGYGFYVWATASFHDSLHAAHDGPVMRRDGPTGSVLGGSGGTNGASFALLEWNDRLIATGAFTQADGQPTSRIAAWDGTQWQPLGDGLDGSGFALHSIAGDLVVGGAFTTAGGQPATGAARWDGSAWHAMGTRALFISSFTELSGILYAAGVFRLDDDSRLNTVARWTGTEWQLVGSGVAYTSSSYPLDVFTVMPIDWVAGYQGDLYCGGFLSHGFGQTTSCMMRLPAANTVGVEHDLQRAAVSLAASPNPGVGRTTFSFALPQPGRVRLEVYDAAGRRVATLVDGEVLAGPHEVRWSTPVRAGVYFARLDAPGGVRRTTRLVRFE
jgi:hypothetical protein